MHNDFNGFDKDAKALKISIPPTLLISAVGVIPDVLKAVSLDAKFAGDILDVLGETGNELGGSEYAQMLKQEDGLVPSVNAKKNHTLYKAYFAAVQKNLVAGAISIGRGGLITALSKSLIAGRLGTEASLENLKGDWQKNYQALFSESQGRILVSIDPKKQSDFEKFMAGNVVSKIGKITNKPTMAVKDKTGKQIINIKINQALKFYKAPFKDW